MFFGRRKLRERIGLFGGSFNPPHVGHTKICKWLFAKGLIDELWIIPCFQHPFGKELEDFNHRLEMCRVAFSKLQLPIQILDVERELGGTSHTLRTVEQLKSDNPDKRFFLVTGSDIKNESCSWYRFDKIRDMIDLLTVPRGENSPIPDVSSTEIRRLIGVSDSFHSLVEKEVALYIVTKGLYRD